MSIARKVTRRTQAIKGFAMQTAGRLTGNQRPRGAGRRDTAKGNIKQYGAKIKNAFRR
ncbi:MAG TPA: CsbD family protein [Streptosporangiaceae bacterium]|nr:CsbD family protein [Streptosporangiaceae bacterium]